MKYIIYWTTDVKSNKLWSSVRRSNQLSYEATGIGSRPFVGSNEPPWRMNEWVNEWMNDENDIWNISGIYWATDVRSNQLWFSQLFDFTSTVQYMIYFIHHFIIHPFLTGLLEPTWPAPNVNGFIAQLVKASHRYREVTGSNPVEVLNYSGFHTQLQKNASITARIIAYLTVVI